MSDTATETVQSKTETAWRVFKFRDDRTDNTWQEVGYVEPRYSYGGPDTQVLGEQFGEGRYLLIGPTAYNVEERQIKAEATYSEVDDESEAI